MDKVYTVSVSFNARDEDDAEDIVHNPAHVCHYQLLILGGSASGMMAARMAVLVTG